MRSKRGNDKTIIKQAKEGKLIKKTMKRKIIIICNEDIEPSLVIIYTIKNCVNILKIIYIYRN